MVEEKNIINFIDEPVKWCSISLSEIIKRGKRLDASVFNIDVINSVNLIKNTKLGSYSLLSEKSNVKKAFHAPRFKRNYVSKSHSNAIGFLGSAEMLEINPKPKKFITKQMAEKLNLFVKKETILLSCSGTIGNITFANNYLLPYAFSQHIIRLECDKFSGYTYVCLALECVQKQLQGLIYGAVIPEIEPHHLEEVIIPNATEHLKEKIHNLIIQSYNLRDESNKLLDEANKLLIEELKLPPNEDFKLDLLNYDTGIQAFSVSLSNLDKRLDASYHLPLAKAIEKHLEKHSKELVNISNSLITSDIILAGVFKRVYVKKEIGIPFLGGKEINQLNPNIDKFISRKYHEKRYNKELKVEKDMILITDRGTIGNVALVPEHFTGWAVSQNVLKLVPASKAMAGYLYIFLSSEIGNVLIKRQTYGSVIDMIDNKNIGNIKIPLLKNEAMQNKINSLALEANEKRYKAYLLEQEAINIMNEEVIYAK